MVVLSFVLLQWGWARTEEAALIRLTNFLRPFVSSTDNTSSRFLLINVAHELSLISQTDSLGIPLGYQVIVNRGKLAHLLERLHGLGSPQRAVVFDIAFQDTSPDDSLFAAWVERVPLVFGATELNSVGDLIPPIIPNLIYGITTLERHDGVVLKARMQWKGGQMSLFAQMALRLDSIACPRLLQLRFGQVLCLNTFALRYRHCPVANKYCDSILSSDVEYISRYIDLSLIEMLSDDILHDFVDGKIIMVGDFTNADFHETSIGYLPGPFILANAYLGLVHGDNTVSIYLILVLWLIYALVSYSYIFLSSDKGRFAGKTYKYRIYGETVFERVARAVGRVAKPFYLVSVLVTFSVLCSIVFNFTVFVLWTTIYAYTARKLVSLASLRGIW